jgi:hypothetical protein
MPTVAPAFGDFLWPLNDGHLGFAAGVNNGPIPGPALLLYDRAYVVASPPDPPIGTVVDFDISLPTEPGAFFHVLFSTGALQGTTFGSRRFPLDPDALLVATSQMSALSRILDATGSATISIPIPSDPALSGGTLYLAGVSFDPAFPFGVRSYSTARSVTIQ